MAQQQDPEDDHTVVVDRAGASDDDDHTVMVDRAAGDGGGEEAETDETVMVTRVAAGASDDDDHTVMVDRAAGGGGGEEAETDETVMVTRVAAGASDDDDHTVMVDRAAAGTDADADADADHTVVVRGKRGKGPATPKTATPKTAATTGAQAGTGTGTEQPQGAKPGRKRRGIAPPPVPVDFAPEAIEAAGPQATEVYRPRSIPPAPVAEQQIVEGAAATRVVDARMQSAMRQSRRLARVTIAAFVFACVVSSAGLVALALIAWG